MKTYIDYDSDAENETKIIRTLPISFFECPKMNVGDFISLRLRQLDGENILTPVKVTHVTIGLEWKA
jgi:hypothetical protein